MRRTTLGALAAACLALASVLSACGAHDRSAAASAPRSTTASAALPTSSVVPSPLAMGTPGDVGDRGLCADVSSEEIEAVTGVRPDGVGGYRGSPESCVFFAGAREVASLKAVHTDKAAFAQFKLLETDPGQPPVPLGDDAFQPVLQPALVFVRVGSVEMSVDLLTTEGRGDEDLRAGVLALAQLLIDRDAPQSVFDGPATGV